MHFQDYFSAGIQETSFILHNAIIDIRWSIPAVIIFSFFQLKQTLPIKDLCPFSLQQTHLFKEQRMIQFSQGMRIRNDSLILLIQFSFLIGIYVRMIALKTKLFKSKTKIISLELRLTTSSFLSANVTNELISSLNVIKNILFQGFPSTVQQSQPQRKQSPYLMVLLMSQFRQKFQKSNDSCLLKNLFSFPQLNSFCKSILFPTCQMKQRSGIKGLRVKLRIGCLKQELQVSSLPKKDEEALDKNPSPFKLLLYRYFTFVSRSLYSTTISCPVRQPMTNSPWTILTDELLALKIKLLTWMVAMILRGRMSVREIVEFIDLVISLLKEYTVRIAVSELQSAPTIKKWS